MTGLADIFAAGPIQNLMGQMLSPRDMLSLSQLDRGVRKNIETRVGCTIGSDPANYNFRPHPIVPVNQMCNCRQSWPANGPVSRAVWMHWTAPGKPGLPTPDDHMRARAARNSNNGTRDLTAIPPITGYPDDPNEWFTCRRANHPTVNDDSVSCIICTVQNTEAARESGLEPTFGMWIPVCGECHMKAVTRYPGLLGYNSCSCEPDAWTKTCMPCFDRVMALKERAAVNARAAWPKPAVRNVARGFAAAAGGKRLRSLPIKAPINRGRRPYPTCPCGQMIDWVKKPAIYQHWYESPTFGNPDFLLGSEFRYEFLYEADITAHHDDGGWTCFCLLCDGLITPNAALGSNESAANRLTFRQALGMGGEDIVSAEWERRGIPPFKD